MLFAEEALDQARLVRTLETAGHSVRIHPASSIGSVTTIFEADLVLVAHDSANPAVLEAVHAHALPALVLFQGYDDALELEAATRSFETFPLRLGDAELCARIRSAVALSRLDRALAEEIAQNELTGTRLAFARASYHELRNQLVVVELGAHALLHDPSAAEDAAMIIASIDQAAQRMRMLFTQLDDQLGEESEL